LSSAAMSSCNSRALSGFKAACNFFAALFLSVIFLLPEASDALNSPNKLALDPRHDRFSGALELQVGDFVDLDSGTQRQIPIEEYPQGEIPRISDFELRLTTSGDYWLRNNELIEYAYLPQTSEWEDSAQSLLLAAEGRWSFIPSEQAFDEGEVALFRTETGAVVKVHALFQTPQMLFVEYDCIQYCILDEPRLLLHNTGINLENPAESYPVSNDYYSFVVNGTTNIKISRSNNNWMFFQALGDVNYDEIEASDFNLGQITQNDLPLKAGESHLICTRSGNLFKLQTLATSLFLTRLRFAQIPTSENCNSFALGFWYEESFDFERAGSVGSAWSDVIFALPSPGSLPRMEPYDSSAAYVVHQPFENVDADDICDDCFRSQTVTLNYTDTFLVRT
ncbi:MAG: hypothetical protein KDD44_14465, partial [Bdellovibrionales bacterium]|nr:hypothetical protein [Bdellovibrionales bacterium]